MLYLKSFRFATEDDESNFRFSLQRTCYDTFYPFGILTKNSLERIDFEPITILYGGNGCGKTTALNIIAEKLGITRESVFNRSSFLKDYLKYCYYQSSKAIPHDSRIVTSDDVFDFMLNLRAMNDGVDIRRNEMMEEYTQYKNKKIQMKSLEDYDELKKAVLSRKTTQSQYVRNNLVRNVREHSNGESALLYFQEKIRDNALYLLDEPENSLSPDKQMDLMRFLEDSARFYGCQFIISTHSPFLLSMHGAKIYDLEENPVDVKKWTELRNVRKWFEFFEQHREEFMK